MTTPRPGTGDNSRASGSDGRADRGRGAALRGEVVAADNLALVDTVGAARANGRTWTQIAAVLGVSKQAARERFGEPSLR